MSASQILFIIVAAGTLGAGLMVVTVRNLVHAALWLVVALFGIAIFYVFLDAGFLAVAQVVIYIGAIAILMIFAIMLTRQVTADVGQQNQTTENWAWAAVLAAVLFGALFWVLRDWPLAANTPVALPAEFDPLQQLGQVLVSPNAFVLPFELASILLLAALIGAIVIAWDRK